jgi:hypothetical protein
MDRILYLRLGTTLQNRFIWWSVSQCDDGWIVCESYDHGKHWIVNGIEESVDAAIKFIDGWMEDSNGYAEL